MRFSYLLVSVAVFLAPVSLVAAEEGIKDPAKGKDDPFATLTGTAAPKTALFSNGKAVQRYGIQQFQTPEGETKPVWNITESAILLRMPRLEVPEVEKFSGLIDTSRFHENYRVNGRVSTQSNRGAVTLGGWGPRATSYLVHVGIRDSSFGYILVKSPMSGGNNKSRKLAQPGKDLLELQTSLEQAKSYQVSIVVRERQISFLVNEKLVSSAELEPGLADPAGYVGLQGFVMHGSGWALFGVSELEVTDL